MFLNLSQMAVGPQSFATTQSPTVPHAPIHLPALQSVFRRMIDSVMKARERQAAERVAEFLRDRRHTKDDFRIELARRLMGQRMRRDLARDL